jgi:hypothetical protein
MQMEQEQMAMQQQAEQEEALRQKQVQEEEISKEADHQRELEKIGVEANISSLQNNEKGVQSELGGDDLQSMVVKLLQTDPSKLVELAKDNPQILQLLELIAEQSNGNSVKEGK